MDNEKIQKIVSEPSSHTNQELMTSMDILSDEHSKTKELIISLTYKLDKLEESYNKVLNEFKNRRK